MKKSLSMVSVKNAKIGNVYVYSAFLLLSFQLAACNNFNAQPSSINSAKTVSPASGVRVVKGTPLKSKQDNAFGIKCAGCPSSDPDTSDWNPGPPTTTEFYVNTITTGTQSQPQVAMDQAGDFVVSWTTNHEADGFNNIYARRFTIDGSDDTVDDTLDASEFKINDDAGAKNYTNSTIALKPNGNKFAVAWENNLASGIQTKAFDFGTATQVGSQLNASGTTLIYRSPDITFNNDNFAVVWQQSRTLTSPFDYDIYGRIGQVTDTMSPTFSYPALETRVHADDSSGGNKPDQILPAVTAESATGSTNADFTTVWVKSNSSIDHIRGFSSTGTPINLTTGSLNPEIAGEYNTDHYTAVWRNTSTTDIFAKRYDGSSTYTSSTINTTTSGTQDFPAVAMNSSRIVVVWQGPDGDGNGIFARAYDYTSGSFGTARTFNGSSNEFRINDVTTGAQEAPSVAMDAAGNFVVTWYDVSGASPEIKAKHVLASAY